MVRLAGVLALLALALLAAPATAGDANVSFQCCAYTPNVVRILPGQTVTWTGANGATFSQHPLTFPNPLVGNQTDTSSSTDRTFAAAGIYLWYCAIHGQYNAATNTVSGMSGRVIATTNTPPTASFTASATDVPSGAEVHFDGTASSDPDSGQTISYSWDLDGDGVADPGQTSATPSAVFTNSGTSPRQVTVRLTVTDTNSDAVGPESGTATQVITVEPAPSSGQPPVVTPPPTTTPPPDTRAPVARIVRAQVLAARVRLTFTSDEPGSVVATLRAGPRKASIARHFSASGRHTVTIRIPRKLRHRRATLVLAVSDDAGNHTSLRRALRLG